MFNFIRQIHVFLNLKWEGWKEVEISRNETIILADTAFTVKEFLNIG